MTRDEIQQLCAAALEEVRPLLHPRAYRDAHDWIHKYGERLLAVEHLIDWMFDDDLSLNHAQFRALEAAMLAMQESDSPYMGSLMRLRPPDESGPAVSASTNPA